MGQWEIAAYLHYIQTHKVFLKEFLCWVAATMTGGTQGRTGCQDHSKRGGGVGRVSCDNTGAFATMNTGYSQSPQLNHLLICLFFIKAHFQ